MAHRFSPQEHLFPEIIEPQMWNEYRQRLHQTLRWQGGDPPANPNFRESVLEHVEDGILLAQDFFYRFPQLHEELSLPVIENMMWSHDGGEILGGDIPASAEHRLSHEERSIQEWIGVMTCALPLLEPSNGLDRHSILLGFLQLYDTFETQDPNAPWAKEAAFTLLIDTLQGNRTALRELYPDPNLPKAKSSMIKIGFPRMLKPLDLLGQRLQHPKTQQACANMFQDYLSTYCLPQYTEELHLSLPKYPHAQRLLQNAMI